jgi:hypothetical protein
MIIGLCVVVALLILALRKRMAELFLAQATRIDEIEASRGQELLRQANALLVHANRLDDYMTRLSTLECTAAKEESVSARIATIQADIVTLTQQEKPEKKNPEPKRTHWKDAKAKINAAEGL